MQSCTRTTCRCSRSPPEYIFSLSLSRHPVLGRPPGSQDRDAQQIRKKEEKKRHNGQMANSTKKKAKMAKRGRPVAHTHTNTKIKRSSQFCRTGMYSRFASNILFRERKPMLPCILSSGKRFDADACFLARGPYQKEAHDSAK